MEAWQIVDSLLDILLVSMLHNLLVKAKDLFFVLYVQVESAQFMHDFAYEHSHPSNYLVMVALDVECLQKVGDELRLNRL